MKLGHLSKIWEKNLTLQMQGPISRVYSFKKPENKNIHEAENPYPDIQQKTACSKILIFLSNPELWLILKETGVPCG